MAALDFCYFELPHTGGRRITFSTNAPDGHLRRGDLWTNLAEYGGIPHVYNGSSWPSRGVLSFGYDSAAYFTITQADGGGVTFNSVSDGTAGFTFRDSIYIDPAHAAKGIFVGVDQNTSGGGIALDVTDFQANGFYADDGGVALTSGYTECLTSRYLISTAVTGGASADVSAAAFHGDLYVVANYSGVGGMSGIWGACAIKTGVTITTVDSGSGYGDFAGGHFTIDLPSGATIAASSWLAGISVGGNIGGTHTGKIAAVRIRRTNGGRWDYGVCIPSDAANVMNKGIFIGADSNSSGSGIALDGSDWDNRAQGNAFYCDDGGVALTGYTECFTARMLTTAAVSSGDVSTAAMHPDLYLNANYTGSGGLNAIWGNTTIAATKTVDTSAGIGDVGGGTFGIDVNGTLAANSHGCGVSVGIGGSGTKNGIICGFRIRAATGTVDWDGILSIEDGDGSWTGMTKAAASETATLTNSPKAGNPAYWLKMYIAETAYYFPVWTD